MRTKRTAIIALVVVLVAVAGLVVGLRLRNNAGDELHQALALAPANTTDLAFTDWALIKQYKGAQGLTSKSSLDDRLHFLASTNQDQAAASAVDLAYDAIQPDTWGWDSTDLVWETTLDISDGPPANVLKFRSDFDFGSLKALYVKRGFSTDSYRGATIYSHSLDLNTLASDWVGGGPLSAANTAVIEGDNLLILSTSLPVVHALLDVRAGAAQSLASDPGFSAVAAQLGTVASAEIGQGSLCSKIGPFSAHQTPAQEAAFQQMLASAGPLHTYAAIGVGYADLTGKPAGLIALHYNTSGDAQTDLKARRTLAQNGDSLVNNTPYSQEIFTLDSANVDGGDLLLHVSPVGGQPQLLFDMWQQRDLLFAACPQ